MLIGEPKDGILQVVIFLGNFTLEPIDSLVQSAFHNVNPLITAYSLSSALLQNHPPLCSGLEWLARLEKLNVVVMAEMLMHTVEE